MLNRFGEWVTALDLTGIVALPVWVLAGLAACAVLVCALTLARADGRGMLAVVVLLIIVLVGWWARDHFAQRDVAAELRALDTRAFELTTRVFAPGSALGCLDANAGETVEAACEGRFSPARKQPPQPHPMLPRSSAYWPPPASSDAATAEQTRGPPCCVVPSKPTASGSWRMCSQFAMVARRADAVPSPGCAIPLGSMPTWRSGRSKLASRVIPRAGPLRVSAEW